MPTRFIITSDLHQSIGKWRDLVRVIDEAWLALLLIAGDLLPKDGGFDGQRKFFPVLAAISEGGLWPRPRLRAGKDLSSRSDYFAEQGLARRCE
jgi:hypothetical protein